MHNLQAAGEDSCSSALDNNVVVSTTKNVAFLASLSIAFAISITTCQRMDHLHGIVTLRDRPWLAARRGVRASRVEKRSLGL